MRSLGRVVAPWALVVLCAGAARATVGGADVIEVLGWDATAQKVYVAQHYRGESGYPPAIASFDLKGAGAGAAVVEPWSVSDTLGAAEYARRDRALRTRLAPLPPAPAVSIFDFTRVLARDTVEVGGGRWPRLRVLASRLRADWDGAFEVTAYRDPSVRVLSLHPIPGHAERLAIVSFLGIPWEGGYETQVPVVIPARADTLRLAWKPFRR